MAEQQVGVIEQIVEAQVVDKQIMIEVLILMVLLDRVLEEDVPGEIGKVELVVVVVLVKLEEMDQIDTEDVGVMDCNHQSRELTPNMEEEVVVVLGLGIMEALVALEEVVVEGQVHYLLFLVKTIQEVVVEVIVREQVQIIITRAVVEL